MASWTRRHYSCGFCGEEIPSISFSAVFQDLHRSQTTFLKGLLSHYRGSALLTSSRLQRWALALLACEYKLFYCPGEQNGIVDALSRPPLPEAPKTAPIPGILYTFKRLQIPAQWTPLRWSCGEFMIQCFLESCTLSLDSRRRSLEALMREECN